MSRVMTILYRFEQDVYHNIKRGINDGGCSNVSCDKDSHETFDLPLSFIQVIVILEGRNRQHVLIVFRVV